MDVWECFCYYMIWSHIEALLSASLKNSKMEFPNLLKNLPNNLRGFSIHLLITQKCDTFLVCQDN